MTMQQVEHLRDLSMTAIALEQKRTTVAKYASRALCRSIDWAKSVAYSAYRGQQEPKTMNISDSLS